MLTGCAELTRIVRDPGIQDYAVASLETPDVRAERFDHTGAIGADDKWEALRGPREAGRDEEIEMIQCRGANADAHLSRLGSGGVRNVNDLELVDYAGCREYTGAHRAKPTAGTSA